MRTHKSAPLRVYVDASVTKSRNAGTVGVVFATHRGRVIGEYSERIDDSRSSAYAEFEAIVRALSFLKRIDGVEHFKLFGDAESVIGIFDSDHWASAGKSEMISYERTVRELLTDFKYYTFDYIPRDDNPAHAVADKAYERVVGHHEWFDPTDDRATRYVEAI